MFDDPLLIQTATGLVDALAVGLVLLLLVVVLDRP